MNLPIVLVSSVLPDLVDKPLWWLGIGAPRYVGHTLLFSTVLTTVGLRYKERCGLSVLLGLGSHLLLDLVGGGSVIPWFYPFVSYKFPPSQFSPADFFSNMYGALKYSFARSGAAKELIWVAAAAAAALVIMLGYRWYSKRRERRDGPLP